MSDKNNKTDGNAPGKFYVEKTCTGCATCTAIAPNNFKLNEDARNALVFKQPANPDEEAACRDAKASCPNEAIGDDGE